MTLYEESLLYEALSKAGLTDSQSYNVIMNYKFLLHNHKEDAVYSEEDYIESARSSIFVACDLLKGAVGKYSEYGAEVDDLEYAEKVPKIAEIVGQLNDTAWKISEIDMVKK